MSYRGINIYHGEDDLKDNGTEIKAVYSGHTIWVMGRPIGFSSFWHRVKCALLVFREKADIVIWRYQ